MGRGGVGKEERKEGGRIGGRGGREEGKRQGREGGRRGVIRESVDSLCRDGADTPIRSGGRCP